VQATARSGPKVKLDFSAAQCLTALVRAVGKQEGRLLYYREIMSTLVERNKKAGIVTGVSVLTGAILAACSAHGQGTTFFVDQKSSDVGHYMEGVRVINGLLGQSFTPTLPGLGYVNLYIGDGVVGGGVAGTFAMNIRSGSIDGAILGTSSLLSLPRGYIGLVTFQFDTEIQLTPGTTYYFQPEQKTQLGGWLASVSTYNYAGGNAVLDGVPDSLNDLWFQEGIVSVPEPSPGLLVLAGALMYSATRLRSKHA
jgi:hypothetical protein